MKTASLSDHSSCAVSERTATSAPVHFIYHVPKCAGLTIDGHLASALPPNAYFRVLGRRGVARVLKPRYDLAEMPDPANVLALGGHYLGVSIESLFVDRSVKRIMLLRDPVSHIVSYYNYRMMHYISQGRSSYSFEVFRHGQRRNFIAHYILVRFLEWSWRRVAAHSDQDKYDAINAFLASFWYVGDYRHCDDLMESLGASLAISGRAIARNTRADWEGRVPWRSLGLDDLTSKEISQIRRENALDQSLWDTWHRARHNTAAVRPVALNRQASSSFIRTEAARLPYRVARRTIRRWGGIQGISMPVPAAATTR